MGHHIQKLPSKQSRLEIFSTMSIQYFVLLFAAVSVLGEPLGRSKDGRKHLDARSAVRHARSEGEESEDLVKAVEELVEKIDSIGKQVKKNGKKVNKVVNRTSSLETEIQKVLPSRFVRLLYASDASGGGQLDESSGRVEVYHEGEWGTVCDDGLIDGPSSIYDNGNKAAQVVCKQLGYSSGVPIVTPEAQRGTGTIWMDSVVCSGEEASLLDCQAN